jgi:hypothetical protein
MSWCWTASALAALALVAAPAPCRAQRIGELQVWGVAAASKPAFYGAGLGYGSRDLDRTRVAGALAAGAYGDGRFGARADLSFEFLLDPRARSGAALYGGGGLTLAVERGHVTPYLLLVLGVEHAPGGRGGTFLEVGVGGGARVALGYRWRKTIAPRR